MKYGKREYRLPKTENRQETGKAESGQVSWVLGLFLILFLAILLYMQLQLAMYKASARYLEDALALSNLASAVIDIRSMAAHIRYISQIRNRRMRDIVLLSVKIWG